MRHRCTSHDSGPSSEPVLTGPSHAAAAIRLSSPPEHGPALVMLLLDAEQRVLLAVVVDGAGVSGVPQVVNLALEVAEPAGVAGLVIGIVQERLGQYLPKPDVAALAGLADRCLSRGIALLDLMLVGPRGWKSVRHLAAAPGGG